MKRGECGVRSGEFGMKSEVILKNRGGHKNSTFSLTLHSEKERPGKRSVPLAW